MTDPASPPRLDATSRAKTSPLSSLRSLAPLLPYAQRYTGWIVGAVIALTLASGATLVVPIAVRRMMDNGFSADSAGLINAYFLAMVAVVGVLAAASAARYYLVITLGERIVADLREDFFRHLASLDAAFYDSAQTGELVSRLTADTTQLKSAFGSSAPRAEKTTASAATAPISVRCIVGVSGVAWCWSA